MKIIKTFGSFVIVVLIIFTLMMVGYMTGIEDGKQRGIKQERQNAINAGVGKYQKNIIDGTIHFRYGHFNE